MRDINRRVLVTASSKGLGKAIAYQFMLNDYDVILHGRDKEKVRKTKELLENVSVEYRNRTIDISCVVGDLRSNDVIEELYKVSKDKISVLVNNAAIPCYGLSLDEMDKDQISNSLETNLVAPIKLTRKIYPLLKKQGYGSIININSIVGKEPKKFRSVHSATKWGLKGFSKSLRLEAKENGIKVINVYPTQIKTVKEHTFGLEPHDVAKKIYKEHIDGNTGELVLDGRPEEFRT
jgi:3-oxoacyl-[acyl-carrier protein] reductase